MTNHSEKTAASISMRTRIVVGLLLVLILLAAAYFRFSGLDWGEYQYLHPDERFLVWVGTDISPVENLSEYFNTPQSSLNPNNRGHGFYVYGTFPMVVTRYIVEWVYGHSGFQEMTDLGRAGSAFADLGTVLLVFLIGRRLYNHWAGLLSAAFSAAAVLQIQQAHFFTMDSFATFFSTFALYFSVLALKSHLNNGDTKTDGTADLAGQYANKDASEKNSTFRLKDLLSDPLFLPSLGFGLTLGMAVASKLNAAAIAVTLPVAFGLILLRLPKIKRENHLLKFALLLIFAAFVSLVVFRILQPYAFSGPGFFGIKFNPQWVQNIREQRQQSTGNVDYPPAMQWARRPVWFSLQNMVFWGLGLPLGILAWAGFLWAGWKLYSKKYRRNAEWYSHALIWSWTFIYFIWQSLQLNPTMRYQLPIYPTLTIFAGWAVVSLFNQGQQLKPRQTASRSNQQPVVKWIQIAAVTIGSAVVLLTFAYAFGFVKIYTRPITRIAASRWIYDKVRGPINLSFLSEDGTINQILPFPYDTVILPELSFSANFQPKDGGVLAEIHLPKVVDLAEQLLAKELKVSIYSIPHAPAPLASGIAVLSDIYSTDKDIRIQLEPSIQLDPNQTYNLVISVQQADTPPAPLALFNQAELSVQPLSGLPIENEVVFAEVTTPEGALPLQISFQAETDGLLTQVSLRPIDLDYTSKLLQAPRLSLQSSNPNEEPLSTQGQVLSTTPDPLVSIKLAEPLPLKAGENYLLSLAFDASHPEIKLLGQGLANEGEWDDGLPLRLDGLDGFGGIFPQDLDFNMYWDDNPEKLERFLRILDEADYIAISSNRQWGTLPRIPERFPFTSLYYRELLGCPADQSVLTCYRDAEPGTFQGNLGFELIKTWTSEPGLNPIKLNDQYAEEAFTVYDHPKVFIFRKTNEFDSEKVRSILSMADFAHIIRKPPLQYRNHPEDLTLPVDRWQAQKAGGTWSELYPPQSPLNRSPALAAVLWFFAVTILGFLFYPILRLALPGLEDHGYPLARVAGMLSLAYLTWLAGSVQIPFSRTTISVVLAILASISLAAAYAQRDALLQDIKNRKRYFLIVEILFLGFFLAFLLIRMGNPDLWHPWKGGEKPMDFAYFNAILKSTSFPPYDPWYAGGYLNYYYFGFLMVGVLVKWLGINPAVAYNLILPTLFSLIAMGAFSLAWNLSQHARARRADDRDVGTGHLSAYIPAVAASIGMAILGNLGAVKMIMQGYQRLAAPGGVIDGANLLKKSEWAVRGFLETLKGASLPYGIGDWYWNPSRIIPAPGDVEPITEFPFFTLLYGDLHAHLIAIPLTLLVLTLFISIVLAKAQWQNKTGAVLWFLLTGLAIGSLRPTNTWDLPLYLLLGAFAVGYAFWNRPQLDQLDDQLNWSQAVPKRPRRWMMSILSIVLLILLAFIMYKPFSAWYAIGYTQVGFWEGTHTPISAYFYHWGVFLIAILPWMLWETRDWLAKTPLSALRSLKPYVIFLQVSALLIVVLAALLVFWREIAIAWFVLPVAVWAGVLTLRSGQPDAKRVVLFMVLAGLLMTLMVEVIVLRGDIGRMNTVFKFYLQVWTLFAISAASAIAWLWPALDDWRSFWRNFWQVSFILIIAGAALYPLMATTAKIEDRISQEAPHTLDGMRYMQFASYTDEWGTMDLRQDYNAIRWMQENVVGSPVIVEANLRNLYRWGSRFSIYTGLPGVVGWEWHQQQQRTSIPGSWITDRILEIDAFYLTSDWSEAAAFLKKYEVEYIILGQQERGHYPGSGLQKFEDANGSLWEEVFRDGATVIYRVIGIQP